MTGNHSFSRRDFLTTSIQGAAALGAGAMVAGCSREEPGGAEAGKGKRVKHQFWIPTCCTVP